MKLTKKQESEVLHIHDSYWTSYIAGDVKAAAALLDEGYSQVGSAETEVFFTKKAAVKFLRATIDQVSGKLEMRNRNTRVEQKGNLVLVHELCDLYALAGKKWIWYSKFRASTLMQKKNNEWKIMHQHSSMPDARTGEGENVAIHKVEKENEQLREAVKRRTVELEHKSRELEIEAALERVRSRSMAMHSSRELKEVITVVMEQFNYLGFNIDLANFNLLTTSKDWTMWLATPEKTYPQVIQVPYKKHPLFDRPINAYRKGRDFMSDVLTRAELKSAMHHFYKTTPLAEYDNKKRKQYVAQGKGLARSILFLKNISLTISNFNAIPYTVEQNAILRRVAHVFKQSYTRFLDLQNAEAQAREAEIELALERVRARTMAMQKSEELQDTANLLFKQVNALGIPVWSCGFNIWEKGDKVCTGWMSSEGMLQPPFKIPLTESPTFIHFLKSKEKGETFYVEEKGGKILAAHYKYMLTLPDFAAIVEKRIKAGYPLRSYQINHVANFKHGNLIFITAVPVPEAHEVFKRFAIVFEQTYTRFLDLQKAEAQAREGQIQLGLERVRARTMAMHKSDELLETTSLIFHQLKDLEVASESGLFGFGIIDGQTEMMTIWETMFGGTTLTENLSFPLNTNLHSKELFQKWHSLPANKRNEHYLVIELDQEEMKDYMAFVASKESRKSSPVTRFIELIKTGEFDKTFSSWVYHNAFFANGILYYQDVRQLPKDKLKILQRFANVFEQSYTRFLDIQKAEAQAREAQIEAALERVRSRSMAMHKSDELRDVIQVVFEQLLHLNFKIDSASFTLDYKVINDFNLWTATPQRTYPVLIHIPYFDHPIFNRIKAANESGVDFFTDSYSFEEKNVFWRHFFNHSIMVTEERQQYILNSPGLARSQVLMNTISLFILNYQGIPYSEAENEILKRFAKVFEQTYTRFLDLQKAEAQAREAQIEAALEKVRSRSLAMHKSGELQVVVKTVLERLDELGISMDAANINVPSKDKKYVISWVATKGYEYAHNFSVPRLNDSRILIDLIEAYESGTEYFSKSYSKADKDAYLTSLFKNSDFRHIPDERKQFLISTPAYGLSAAGTHNSWIQVISYSGKILDVSEAEVLKRFARVFEQCYIRFQDLEKAEEQAREAQIEAALERVRAKAMAMHTSDDLATTIRALFNEINSLSSIPIIRCGAGLLNKDHFIADLTSLSRNAKGELVDVRGEVDMTIHPLLKNTYNHWLLQQSYYHVLRGNEIKAYYELMSKQVGLPDPAKDAVQHFYFPMFAEGSFYVVTENELTPQEIQVFNRFVSVLSLTYRRYNDLRQAEAQARAATIEAALERVRAKAMAMHSSADVSEAASMVFTELRKLNIKLIRSGVGVLSKETTMCQIYAATSSEAGDGLSLVGWANLTGHPVLENIYNNWLQGNDYFPELSGELLKTYYEQLAQGLSVPVPNFSVNEKQFGAFLTSSTSPGPMYAWSDTPYNDDEKKILKRFASIIDLTFRRYFELQTAESNTKEAIRQASLDRVRAEIASMRTIQDLDRITPLIWSELTTLGVPFIRCGVFIMDEDQQQVQSHLSTPDGKAIAAFRLNYNATNQSRQIVAHWQQKKIFRDHMDEAAFIEFTKDLVQQGAMSSGEKYLTENRPTNLHLHFLPFLQGMLYVGNTAPLSEDELQLAQNLADAFSTAYARYEDFNKLEAAKTQVDKTLTELKQAQQLLVQSEKMASLGELTAGIAHEIQNPLNFVNNFSEVSNELIQELKTERLNVNRDDKQEDDILTDISTNLEKIHYHGKRAADIVKGMLQHSRSSSGQKELTDINVLCDEYLRLSYHGLRAKDKSFNAKLESQLDPTLPRINVVPQDIGRVILNLINNAFYAVSEKQKAESAKPGSSFEPTVIVSTHFSLSPGEGRGEAIITVKDNGNGIPQKVLDKIFQPFFTTKPTGQGTGLGLSLSYDIVKAHGGVLQVETKEGDGSKFSIFLPGSY
jgi:signal transduction histidine kinase/ketosteroid isomerase-like protein